MEGKGEEKINTHLSGESGITVAVCALSENPFQLQAPIAGLTALLPSFRCATVWLGSAQRESSAAADTTPAASTADIQVPFSAAFHARRAAALASSGIDVMREVELRAELDANHLSGKLFQRLLLEAQVVVYSNPGLARDVALARSVGRSVVYFMDRLHMLEASTRSVHPTAFADLIAMERQALTQADIIVTEHPQLAHAASRLLSKPIAAIPLGGDHLAQHIHAHRSQQDTALSALTARARQIYADLHAALLDAPRTEVVA